SVALLTVLAHLRRVLDFSVTAVTVDPGFEGGGGSVGNGQNGEKSALEDNEKNIGNAAGDTGENALENIAKNALAPAVETATAGAAAGEYAALEALCRSLEVPFVLKRTNLWEWAGKQTRPCSLCARLRRGALHSAAVAAGCDTVALGHHMNDAAETFLMNLLDGRRLACFAPKATLDHRGLTLIRPFVFVPERDIAAFVKAAGLPVLPSRCPVDGDTRRAEAKEWLAMLSSPEKNIVAAMQKARLSGW
ncbi:MAG: hypothetical protein FWF49_00285, partial [Oscillospiraceae bacterium]|nr:hypothetical protein [Oscillospiraceae bacterium]